MLEAHGFGEGGVASGGEGLLEVEDGVSGGGGAGEDVQVEGGGLVAGLSEGVSFDEAGEDGEDLLGEHGGVAFVG